jgi:4-alpha-glucanotransferase
MLTDVSEFDSDQYPRKSKSKINYEMAIKEKAVLLDEAWNSFAKRKPAGLNRLFSEFMEQEKSWLDGYAEFSVLRKHFKNAPWGQWPIEYRRRDETTIRQFNEENREELLKIKWIQFIFFRQMKELREYCNERGIRLMGDVPFYVHQHSVDVWLYRDAFEVDDEGNVGGIAGVPPDYFNSEGQLWGMPVYNWAKNKDGVYRWWVERLRKNLQMYDLVRLDHFRAFADYWRVEGGAKNAVKGEWIAGPGIELFDVLKRELGELWLVAEDLGDVGDNVYDLRDKLGLPGMKVSQFGFGSEFPTSVHLPHNYGGNFIAYPGTHDNNTTRGWYNEETGAVEKRNLSSYFNTRVAPGNVSNLFMRIVYSSHANMAIVAMQDVLDLDERSRINTPSTTEGNWTWRMKEIPGNEIVERLRKMVWMYER